MHKVPYTPAFSTPDSKDDDSTTLKIRPLFVDSKQKEWTVGELHNISDRSFAIRRALHINDALPNDPGERWVWQPASWIVVDRTTGHITALAPSRLRRRRLRRHLVPRLRRLLRHRRRHQPFGQE